MRKVLPVLLALLMSGCKNTSFKKQLVNHNGEVIFSLNCPEFKNRPIVTIEDSGLIFYFLVDTGNTLSFINENGCQKMNFDLDENEDLLGGSVNFYLEDERYLVDGKAHILRMPVRKNEFFSEKEIDGMLGIDFLSQYDNVVLDYKQRKIKFNQSPINSHPITMYKTSADVFYIYYSLDGIKDFGLLDTGSDGFVVRENYQTDYVEISDMQIQEIIKHSVYKKEKCNVILFNQIEIAGVSYKDIIGYFAKDERIQMDKDSAKEHRLRSILGYTFFKDHIIQLDFKNNLFYIE